MEVNPTYQMEEYVRTFTDILDNLRNENKTLQTQKEHQTSKGTIFLNNTFWVSLSLIRVFFYRICEYVESKSTNDL